ncbi:MAG: hypothetical protein M5R36_00015 [Deltaproteobacteria bacterium]|nr:hypothetical protein [Deltaproteobacteria bacterium]
MRRLARHPGEGIDFRRDVETADAVGFVLEVDNTQHENGDDRVHRRDERVRSQGRREGQLHEAFTSKPDASSHRARRSAYHV